MTYYAACAIATLIAIVSIWISVVALHAASLARDRLSEQRQWTRENFQRREQQPYKPKTHKQWNADKGVFE